MKHYTQEEIEKKFYELFMQIDEHHIGDVNITEFVDTPERITFKVSAMYDSPPFNSVIILGLCEFFDTRHINDIDRWSYGGCETCDWGSSYGYTLEVLP